MQQKINFDVNGDTVSFYKPGWKQVAHIDNDTELLKIVKSSSWSDKNGYLYSAKLKMYLHRLVIARKIGDNRLSDLTAQGFVVDHINNSEPYNCCLDNLHIIPLDLNIAKGHTVDKDIERVRLRAGIGLYCLKDEAFQIAIGFNDRNICLSTNETQKPLDTLHLTYNSFDKCYVALQSILLWLKNEDGQLLRIDHLEADKIDYTESTYLKLTEEEKNGGPIIQRGDHYYFKINNTPGNKMAIIHKPHKIE